MASHPLLKVKGRRDSLVFRLASGGPTVIVKESPDYLRVEAWLYPLPAVGPQTQFPCL